MWIIVFYIIRNVFLVSRQRPGGTNLSLKNRLAADIIWQGHGGLKLDKMKCHILLFMTLADVLSYILIHIGGNDIGETRHGYLVYKLKKCMSWLSQQMPRTQLIWSQVLPRTVWRFSTDNNVMERTRRRLNSSMGSYMCKNGGGHIH